MEHLVAYAPLLLRGTLVTVALALLSLALATLLGGVAAALRLGRGYLGPGVAFGYSTLVRGIPDLVLLLLIYFGGQRLINSILIAVGAESVSLSPFWAGVIAIGFMYGAYLAETFRGAYLTVPRGQIEAAHALGMRGLRLFWTVTLPQLIRFALPGYANVWQVLVKSTAVVSVIGLEDLVGLANDAGKTVREPFLFFSAVLLVYLAITWASTRVFYALEDRYGVAHAR